MTHPLLERFEQLLEQAPDKILVASRARSTSVAGVHEMARSVERRLKDASLDAGGLLGLVAPAGPGFLAGLLALRRMKLAALLIDPGTPLNEQVKTARALGAPSLLTLTSPWPEDEADWVLSAVPGVAQPAELNGVGVVKLTSGSTGEPRGIATSEKALVCDADALNRTMGITPDDRLLSGIPLSHSYGLSTLAVTALTQGTTLVLPDGLASFEPFLAAKELGATVFPTVPAFLHALLHLSDPPAQPARLRLVISAGAPLTPTTAVEFRRSFGLPVHVFYGASECGGICYDREGSAGERGTVGTPVDGVRVTLDASQGALAGAVVIASPAVAEGYHPAADSSLGDGCFRSKDQAEWRDGELALLGRREDWINVGGKKVNPREVEAVLKQLDGIEDAAVFGFTIPGREGESVRAVVAGGDVPGYLEVVARCRDSLAAHKVPRSVLRVREIPRTPRGKLDWSRIREMAATDEGL